MFKSFLMLLCFFAAQIVSCLAVFTCKSFIDYEWLNKVYDVAGAGGDMFSAEYISLINEVMYPALLISDILIILPVLIKRKKPLCKKISAGSFFYYICLGGVLNFIVSVIVAILPTQGYDSLMSVVLTGSPLIVLTVSGVAAPVVEEVVFRHCMINALEKRYNLRAALIVSSLLFGIAHMNLVQSTYAFLLGLVLGRVYQKERNLFPAILIHITINASSVIYKYSSDNLRIVLLSGVIISTFFLLIYAKKFFKIA